MHGPQDFRPRLFVRGLIYGSYNKYSQNQMLLVILSAARLEWRPILPDQRDLASSGRDPASDGHRFFSKSRPRCALSNLRELLGTKLQLRSADDPFDLLRFSGADDRSGHRGEA
jgi:hypothetical protein